MDLEGLRVAFEAHHRALGHSKDTIRHYNHSIGLLIRFLEEVGVAPTAEHLTSTTMNTFAGWLRATPARQWRGKTDRSIWGVHGALKDVKAFVRWLAAEEQIPKAPKVPVPRLPQRLFPILSDADLDRMFASRNLSGGTEVTIRNRAMIALMLDTVAPIA